MLEYIIGLLLPSTLNITLFLSIYMYKFTYGVPTRTKLLFDAMILAEKIKSRPDYTHEKIPELLAKEAGLEENALTVNSFNRRTQVLRELAVYLLKEETGQPTEKVAQRLGYHSICRVQQINASMRKVYEGHYEKVRQSMTVTPASLPSEDELAQRLFQELLCSRLKREFPALAQFSKLSIDEIAERFDLAPLYAVDTRTLREALKLYFER